MALEYSEQLDYEEGFYQNSREWSRDTQRRTFSWKLRALEWKQPFCKAESIPSSQEQSIALNTEIDKLYEELAILVKQRDSRPPDPQLEEKIAQRFQRLRALQKQEGDFIRAMFAALPNTQLNTGLAILEQVEQLRAKYGNPATTDSSTTDSSAPKA